MKHFATKLSTATLALALSTGLAGAADYTMTIASGSSSGGNICKGLLDVWAEKVKEESGGRIDYNLICDGNLAKMGDVVNRVASGVADVGWDLPGIYGARFAGLNVVGLPGAYSDPEVAAGALWKAYETGELGTYDEIKMGFLMTVSNSSIWTTEPLESVTDLDNAKIGMGNQVRAVLLDTMNGSPMSLRVPEYYQALAKGAATGLLTTAGAVFDFSIQEIVTDVYQAPFGGGLTIMVVNNDFYQSLPDDLKAVIDNNTGYDTSRWASAYLRDREVTDLASVDNITIHKLSDDEIGAWGAGFEASSAKYIEITPNADQYIAAFTKALEAEAAQ